LQARYGLTIDDQDLDGSPPLFARDGRFGSFDGVMNAQRLEALSQQFRSRFAALRFGFVSVSPTPPCGDAPDSGFATAVIGGGGGWIWTRGYTTALEP